MERDTFRLTDWLVSPDGRERSRVKYGMRWLSGNKLPYFSITLERCERNSTKSKWQYAGGGAALEEIAEKFPALALLVKWHLCNQDGTPMHYLTNSIFWYEIVIGARVGTNETRETAMKNFRSCAVWTDHVSERLCPRNAGRTVFLRQPRSF